MSILGGKIDIFGGYVYSLDMSDHSPFDPNIPYNNLPPLPPRDEVETVAVLKAVIAANKELGALDSACRLISNPAIITSTIPLREAQASSEIENIVTTNDELFRAAYAVDAEPTPATKEALRYNKALHLGVESLATRPLSIHTAQQVCSALHDAPAVVRSMPGTYIGDPVKKIKFYTPPEGKEIIEQHLSQWERFIYSDHGLDPLVLLALLHYQFEAIHPFYDGNGRTGRILNILLLVQEGLLRLSVLYLSGYIVNNKADYYRLLRAVTTEGAWEEWIIFLVKGIEESARTASTLIEKLWRLQDRTASELREKAGISPAKELAELLFTHPYIRIKNIEEAGLAKRQTAAHWLSTLADLGILVEVKHGRQKVFINQRELDVLTAP